MATGYGDLKYGQGAYGGKTSKYSPVGATLYIYDRFDALKGAYQMGAGQLISCNFKHDEAGCNSFSLQFSGYADIAKSDYVKIYIMDSDDCFFTGVIRSIPIRGSTNQDYVYSGYGFNDYLVRINTGAETYTGETIRDIVEDLITTKVETQCPIIWSGVNVDILDTVITEISFKYVSIFDALDQLKAIANADGNDYRVGVDENGNFMFKARQTETLKTLIVAAAGLYGIKEYNPTDSEEAKSRIYVLKKDGTYYGAYSTTETRDIFEIKLTAPDIDDDDIDAWAAGQLWKLEQEERKAKIKWQIENIKPFKLMADGYLRIICNRPPTVKNISGSAWGAGVWGAGIWGGEQYTGITLDDTLKVKEVEYSIDAAGAIRGIQLGSVPVTLDREMIEINKEIERLKITAGV